MRRSSAIWCRVVGLALLADLVTGCGAAEPTALRSGSPADALPPHISRLLDAGLRPDWSHDGKRLLFLDELVGNVFEVDLETREIRNYSKNWGYDEAEGVFPDGRFAAVEREPRTYTMLPKGSIDIWRTALDGSARTTRLTHFSEFAGFGASNPVVSPDGRWMAFQIRDAAGALGNGQGIFLLDLRALPTNDLTVDATVDEVRGP